MKKQRGDMITFFVLTFISGFLIFDCVAAGLGTGRVMDSCYEAVNGCHIITSRFDPRDFNFENCEIKRNAFTLLYYNNDISCKQK